MYLYVHTHATIIINEKEETNKDNAWKVERGLGDGRGAAGREQNIVVED